MPFARQSAGPWNLAPGHEDKEARLLIHPDEACKLGFAHGVGFWTAGVFVSFLLAVVVIEGYSVLSGRLASSETAAANAAAPIIDDADAEDAVSVSRVDPLSLPLVHES